MRFSLDASSSYGLVDERMFHGDPGDMAIDPMSAANYCAHETRVQRYQIYWSMYLNDIYRNLFKYGFDYKATYALDRHVRGDYNPAARLVKFHAAHVAGGRLDPEAGPGMDQPTCLPFIVDDGIRPAIAKLLSDSRWSMRKARWVRYGSCLGDGPIMLRHNRVKKQVTIAVLHPSSVEWLERDDNDSVTAACILEQRMGNTVPDAVGMPFLEYRLEMQLDPMTGDVFFKTTRDKSPYDWDAMKWPKQGGRAEWVVKGLGACPLWNVAHGDTDLPFGTSELEIGRQKMDRANDMASKLHDQIRKLTEGAWLLTGMSVPSTKPRAGAAAPTIWSPEQAKQDQKVFYANNPDAKAHSLVNNVPIAEISNEIRQELMSIEDDYPELKFERLRTSGDISGEAMRTARQPAAASIEQMRTGYDQCLIEAIRCALRWGDIEGYAPYSGLGIDSINDERLMAIRIGDRPVFAVDSMDRLDEQKKRWDVVLIATQAGAPLEFAMRTAGYTEQDITTCREIKPMPTERLKIEIEKQKVEAQKMNGFNRASSQSPTGSRPKPALA